MGSQGGRQYSQFQIVGRQSSFYSLTLNEVQSQLGNLGKPFGSMNLDELIKNIWSVEADQVTGTDVENVVASSGHHTPAPGLQHQGSGTLARTLSKKTVDEAWREIQRGKVKKNEERKPQEQHLPFGEMTLEDFLMKAGVVPETGEKETRVEGDLRNLEGICNVGAVGGDDLMSGAKNFPQQAQWMMQYQPQQQNMMNAFMSGHDSTQPLGVSASPLLDIGYSENPMAASPLMGTLSDTQTPGRKRVASGDVADKSIERRQKRMIKNRESAARSRARKQAYTNELEYKVSCLEEENERLKKQKALDKILHCSLAEPKYQLRRTSSAPF
ncbi:hypothetical protein AAC387_Pa03g0842 [Persea americana]